MAEMGALASSSYGHHHCYLRSLSRLPKFQKLARLWRAGYDHWLYLLARDPCSMEARLRCRRTSLAPNSANTQEACSMSQRGIVVYHGWQGIQPRPRSGTLKPMCPRSVAVVLLPFCCGLKAAMPAFENLTKPPFSCLPYIGHLDKALQRTRRR